MDALKAFFQTLFYLVTYSETDYELLNRIVFSTSDISVIVMAVALLLLILLYPKLREHKRFEDKLVFSECVLMLIALSLTIVKSIVTEQETPLANFFWYYSPTVQECLYMLTILQWLVFVDYSLYRSRDRIRRRYKGAIIPILLVVGFDVFQDILAYGLNIETEWMLTGLLLAYIAKFAVEFGYIFLAIRLVVRYGKESRQPRFLRLSAFIIPFVLGILFRFYDMPMMALGVMLTYIAVIRRDRYLDHDTGFYNHAFLDFLSTYRDRKKYEGGNGFMIHAPGHKEAMAKILKEMMPEDSNLFYLGEDRFLVLSESLRGSAAKMATNTIREAAENAQDPFIPEITVAKRGNDESAGTFANRLLKESGAAVALQG